MIKVLLFREQDGSAPFLKWFGRLPELAQVRCRARLSLLEEFGHLLRRPAAEYLGGGIFELRIRVERVQYRILYFFHDRSTAVISHGLVKKGARVPRGEISRAVARMERFLTNPEAHTLGRDV